MTRDGGPGVRSSEMGSDAGLTERANHYATGKGTTYYRAGPTRPIERFLVEDNL